MKRVWSSKVDSRVVGESVVDSLQARRALGGSGNGETHAHRLVLLDVGVLANDDHFEVTEASLGERVEDQLFRRVARTTGVFCFDVAEKFRERGAFEVRVKGSSPGTKATLERFKVF